MRILCITDLHGNAPVLKKILLDAGAVDLVFLGGDLTTFGTPDEAERLVRAAQTTGVQVLAVAGNCDSPEIDRRLADLGVSAHGVGCMIEGVAIQGLSAMPPWRRTMYQFTEEELGHFLAAGCDSLQGARPHVVLSHAPPRDGKLDRTFFGKHVGSTALKRFIDEKQPDVVVCGHIHEGRGKLTMGRTDIVNCGHAARRYYALVDVGSEIQIELRRA